MTTRWAVSVSRSCAGYLPLDCRIRQPVVTTRHGEDKAGNSVVLGRSGAVPGLSEDDGPYRPRGRHRGALQLSRGEVGLGDAHGGPPGGFRTLLSSIEG